MQGKYGWCHEDTWRTWGEKKVTYKMYVIYQ